MYRQENVQRRARRYSGLFVCQMHSYPSPLKRRLIFVTLEIILSSKDPGMPHDEKHHRAELQSIARRVMMERGFLTEFSPQAIDELGKIKGAAVAQETPLRDERELPWCSIDNDDSLDLDQLSVALPGEGGATKILVAVADVDALVKKGSAIDDHAKHNTTSVYTPAAVFPMLPERLSTDLTSLNLDADRIAIVFDMVIAADGSVQASEIYRAVVRNRAKLAYDNVAAWLEGKGPVTPAVSALPGLEANIRLQYTIAEAMKGIRHQHGALDLETIQSRAVFDGDAIRDLLPETRNRARDIIEDFMISANGVSARYLSAKGLPSLRRVVRTPKRWDRIVELARERGTHLPTEPDSKALNQFLVSVRAVDPANFPDLSLSTIKLLGPGEYVVEYPGGEPIGHFGLAVRDYSHSTAPNRRYPDLITHRILKAAMVSVPAPYEKNELEVLAKHCTEQEDAAKKVERQVEKSSAAMYLESRIGDRFDAIVTGAAEKGTWVRLMQYPIEGKLMNPARGIDVGHHVRVELIHTDAERGYIDFKAVGS